MTRSILSILIVSVLFSCNKESTPIAQQIQEETTSVQQRAPTIPEPEIMDQLNTGCVANILFLAEGFTNSQMSEFKALSAMAKQAILDMQPFTAVTDHLNFYRVYSVSETSGIATTKFDSACNGITGVDDFGTTPWAVFANRVGLQYYAGMKSGARDHLDDLYGGYATGDYAYTIIIVNDAGYYGGAEFPGVTQYNTIASPRVSNMIVSKYDSGDYFKFLVRHEFGHSFGNMDDEYEDALTYCAIKTYEPWFLPPTPKRNIKTYNPGTWTEGGRYVPNDYWRQWPNSIMRDDYFSTTFSPIQGSIVKRRLAHAIACP